MQTKRVTKVGKSDTYISQVAQMTDKQLLEELRQFGEDPGPITDTTRGVYQRKLAKHLAEKPKGELKIQETSVLYSKVIEIESVCILVP